MLKLFVLSTIGVIHVKVYYQVIMLIPFLLLILLGLDCFFAVSNATASYSWDSTEGTIVNSHYTPSQQNGKIADNLDLTYSYTVGNKTYTSKNVDPVGPFYITYIIDQGLINKRQYANEYPKGAKVMVYYNPSNPSVSSLTQGWAFSNYVELVIFLVISLSSIIALLTFNINPHLNKSFNAYEKILIQFFLNFFFLGFTIIIVGAVLYLYLFLILVLSFMITLLIGSTINQIANLLNNILPKDILSTSTYYIFSIILFIGLLIICLKAYRSITVRKYKKYPYELTKMNTEHDAAEDKWLLNVSISYKIAEQVMNVTHSVKKKFSSEEKAQKFFDKKFKPVENAKEMTGKRIRSMTLPKLVQYYGKGIIYVPPNQGYSDEEVLFGYEILPIALIAMIPLFFVIYDMILGLAFKFVNITGNKTNGQTGLSIFFTTHVSNLINIVYVSIYSLVILAEILCCVYIIFVLGKGYYHRIYYNTLWGRGNASRKEDLSEESR